MPLESLLELVETLRERIDEHGAALSQSEALTRAALIDPLLRELGWDTEDPAAVMPEYRLGKSSADYALLNDGKPALMVEAKKLGEPLANHRSQGIGYCIEDGIGYFALTDGRQWEIYETHKMAPIAEKMIVQFDLAQSPPITCLKAMALWRPTVEHGSVMVATTPIVGLDTVKQGTAEPMVPPIHEPEPMPQEQPAIQRPPATVTQSGETGQEWIPLSNLSPQGGDLAPVEIQFPNEPPATIKSWNDFIHKIVNWLIRKDILKKDHCPIPVGPKQCVVNTKPKHLEGQPFHSPESVNGFFIEKNFSTPNRARNARVMLVNVGQDPAQFKVRLR